MQIKAFDELLQHPDPGFACYLTGDALKREQHIVRVEHYANKPAKSRFLKKIPDVPGADAARAFYAAHDGAFLYTASEDSGLEIFPISKWPERTASMVESWIDGEYEDEKMPYGRNDFIAFAHVHGAASHIHWVVNGPTAGQIFWWAWTMRPDKGDPPVANDFSTFIDLAIGSPVRLMTELIPYTWWSSKHLTANWKPIRYVPDCGQEPL